MSNCTPSVLLTPISMLSKSMKTAIFSRVSAKTFCLPFDTAASPAAQPYWMAVLLWTGSGFGVPGSGSPASARAQCGRALARPSMADCDAFELDARQRGLAVDGRLVHGLHRRHAVHDSA